MKKKFYAVKKGRQTGIFLTWDECKKQVQGFAGALFKGFVLREEAEAYLGIGKQLEEENTSDGCFIYVDGSYYQGRYSWGLAAYYQGEIIHTDKGVGTSTDAAKLHNVAGEIAAAMEAVRWAEQQDFEKIILCHDYIGLSEWAEGRWKTNTATTADYAAFMVPYRGRITFQKVAGHTGVTGNELADALAKEALGLIPEKKRNTNFVR